MVIRPVSNKESICYTYFYEVGLFLQNIGLPQYVNVFKENGVDGARQQNSQLSSRAAVFSSACNAPLTVPAIFPTSVNRWCPTTMSLQHDHK